jgi:tetratricopeptide (TPR) repeat protein
MSRRRAALGGLLLLAAPAVFVLLRHGRTPEKAQSDFVGSATCRGCHPDFYKLWAPSRHGLAMQPYRPEFASSALIAPAGPITIGERAYRVEFGSRQAWVVERSTEGEKRYEIAHVLGGKNVYYFLTPLERGRLQVLPLAYDVRRKVWYDTAASGVRHFPDRADSPLEWRDRPFTFNTACYSCHVSQLTTHYDPDTDSYRTRWAEPGINCETCHGPAGEHVRLFEQSSGKPEDPRIIRTRAFDAEQKNALCAPCHAKMIPLTADFRPGDRYFDHFDLVALEHPDFYPDGRDLGENYTYTSWRMSPCAQGGKLDCLHCHTSSGRYRFAAPDRANEACLPCHQDKVANLAAHSHHPGQSEASRCVACHMPVTEFARMRRSDHSMRAPAPAATLRFGSPNACNLCHSDRDAAWADRWVRRWYRRDYQAPVLRRAELIEAARKGDWSKLGAIAAYLSDPAREEIYAASLLRLLRQCDREEKWAAILKAIGDPSPLVRASAADALAGSIDPVRVRALVRACRDEYRLVRIRAAAALGAAEQLVEAIDRPAVERATAEFEASMRVRPDDPGSHVNLGNFYLSRRQLARAVAEFELALKIDPRHVPALVNASLAHNLAGRNGQAERCLRAALAIEPASAAANFNLGLLLGELGRTAEAKEALRRAWNADPSLAAAAYNLCVLEAGGNPEAALSWCRQAASARPQEPKYAYTLAYYLSRDGRLKEAASVLEGLLRRHPEYTDGYALLGQIYAAQGDRAAAARMFERARVR